MMTHGRNGKERRFKCSQEGFIRGEVGFKIIVDLETH